jgi:hypothetical protein
MSQRALWLSGGAAAVAYVALIAVGQIMVTVEAAGLAPFDLRIGGYTEADAAIYLAALSEAGRAAYLGPVRVLDTIFPVLFALFLALLSRAVWARGGWVLAASLPALYLLFDLWENARVAAMVAEGDPSLAGVASALTQAKFAALGVFAVLLLWSGFWVWKRRG